MGRYFVELHTIKPNTQKKEPEQGKRVAIEVDSIVEIKERAVGCMICKKNGTETIVFESYDEVIEKMLRTF